MDVALDAGGHVSECVMTSHRAKAREVGLREALVLADQRLGERDVLDEALSHEVGEWHTREQLSMLLVPIAARIRRAIA